MENKLLTVTRTVTIQGASTKSKEDAVQTAFSSLRNLVTQDLEGVMIYMKPLSVEVEDYSETEKKERYLGFLFSRTIVTYRVTLRVEVEVSTIQL